jgi:hypothetical protein
MNSAPFTSKINFKKLATEKWEALQEILRRLEEIDRAIIEAREKCF